MPGVVGVFGAFMVACCKTKLVCSIQNLEETSKFLVWNVSCGNSTCGFKSDDSSSNHLHYVTLLLLQLNENYMLSTLVLCLTHHLMCLPDTSDNRFKPVE